MDPAPESPSVPPPALDHHPHRPRGKIARLPPDIRAKLNTLIDQGLTYKQIIDALSETISALGPDAPQLTEQDLSRWYDSGFQDWSKNQLWLEQTRSRLDMAIDVVHENTGSDVHLANLHIAATQLIHDLIQRGEKLLDQHPEQYVDVVNSVSRISREALNFQKYREACHLARAELAKLKNPDHPPSQEETLAVVNRLDQILGFK